METPKLKIDEVTHKVTGWIGKGFLVICVLIVGYSFVAQATEAKQPLVPQATATYKATGNAHCNAELNLVNAKLSDFGNGLMTLPSDEVKRLAEKKEAIKCDF